MARFTVRIELRNADSSDYDKLYDKMKAKGFSKFITADSGNKYELPPAEYNFISKSKSCQEVRDLAYNTAKSVNSNPAVLVTESNGRRWEGLDEA
ncbi:type V toxin-antitoxin system endoribonuclease antitoxin GhoS [Xenorhabdus szentirmaii]|uniref:type V toxin-antitoxin system endoribonuclease antitoxin GhoS n=1 Tax=Xenorhabdus szentirmaii TaxID=290112 RepID=UPI0019883985|nr:type V toxin-antitoxin system endoribonuclease antitoxin GhoS [Xenorhabdus sp. 5]MBD2827026.1 type V toxin-antitoxin system endoribonuclease antitoxin GhoS [Xenorhabdus sp. 5]